MTALLVAAAEPVPMQAGDRRRRMPRIGKVVEHWMAAATDVFPDLIGHIYGFGEAFCFRCGWLSPVPELRPKLPWSYATGWLQLAHLHDRATGGPDTSDNLVPLCMFCHRVMPEFPDGPEAAIEWVKAGHPVSCSSLWQFATDAQWSGERFIRYPGSRAVDQVRLQFDERVERHRRERAAAGLA